MVVTMDGLNRVQLLRKRTGLSQSKFAAYFNMPTKTLQKWEINMAVPPDYVLGMMERILDLEDKLNSNPSDLDK